VRRTGIFSIRTPLPDFLIEERLYDDGTCVRASAVCIRAAENVLIQVVSLYTPQRGQQLSDAVTHRPALMI